MPVTLSITNLPEDVVRRVRERAKWHCRSFEDELIAIIEAAVQDECPAEPPAILVDVRELELRSPSEAADIVRSDSDAR